MNEEYRQLSWRDPDGFVVKRGARLFRAVNLSVVERVNTLLDSPWIQARIGRKEIPATRWVSSEEVDFPEKKNYRWLEHECLEFPCYPHEVTALQLHDSAKFTLELALSANANGWELKDASAWNVLFAEGRPVFCDILSFVRSTPSIVWNAYSQFQRHFIIPLLLHRLHGLPPAAFFLSQRDGVDPVQARRLITGLRAWRQPALEAVTMPAMLASVGKRASRQVADVDPVMAQYVLQSTLQRLARHLTKIRPIAANNVSKWSHYTTNREHYSDDAIAAKKEFVRRSLKTDGITTVLDLGCNTGEFSFIAEACGKKVVAADNDWRSLDILYSEIRRRGSSIQSLYIDLGRPTPAIGWDNREVPSILDRLRGRFDCLFVLGLIHHLLISERVALPELCRMLFWLGSKFVVVEWIEPSDPRFRELAGQNAPLYESLSRQYFESLLGEYFHILDVESLPLGTRTLFLCENRKDLDS